MCGINGFNWPDRELITKMNSALAHRGPDGEGTYLDDSISLGSRRLAIIDLSEKGKMPMCNEDGSIMLVYNGEIYNFGELKKELVQKGHVFKSDTDTEVVLHAYEEWQSGCLDRFNGMFAFAIYDSKKRNLFLARDRFGIKPLYYYAKGDKFIFSSEIKGILSHDVDRKPNDRIVFDYLRFSLVQHSNETFFEGIYQLPGGHYLTYDCRAHRLTISQWYSLHTKVQARQDKDNYIDEIRDLFSDSIRLRMIADVPVGSCLSGGLDSSSIVGAMRKLSANGDIRTFSSVFPTQKIDESKYVKEVVDFAGLKSSLVSPDADGLLEDLPDLIKTQEEPFLGPSVYAQYKVMKLAHRNGMKVLLDGQGGDEVMGGYTYYFGFYFYELLRRLRWWRLSKEVIGYYRYFRNILPMQMLGFLLLPSWLQNWSWGKRVTWVNKDIYRKAMRGKARDPRWQVESLNEGLAVSISQSSIPHLLMWEDKNSMRWSVETRIPFLDYRLVEMMLALPAEVKLKNGVTKHIFRQAVTGMIPRSIGDRRDKVGFAVPEDKWLKNAKVAAFITDLVESDSFKGRKYWDQVKVKAHLDRFLNKSGGNEQAARDIWRYVNMEMWLRQFIDHS